MNTLCKKYAQSLFEYALFYGFQAGKAELIQNTLCFGQMITLSSEGLGNSNSNSNSNSYSYSNSNGNGNGNGNGNAW